VISSLLQVLEFVAILAAVVAVLELYLHLHFTYFDRP